MTTDPPAFPLDEHPRLRPVEAFPATDSGRRFIVLRDPSDPTVEPIVLRRAPSVSCSYWMAN